MSRVQEYLRNYGLQKLCEEFGIRANRNKVLSHLVLLKYSQFHSPMKSPIVQECRGIILDSENNWEIIARPYDKFFNYGEREAASIDWNSARVYEKLDGSLMTLYYTNDSWHVATRGMACASGQVLPHDFSFAELFWQVWNELGYTLPEDCSKTYMFELMTDKNRIIALSPSNRIVLHGVRDTATGTEYFPESTNWECARSWSFSNLEEIVAAAKHLNPMDQEGYVVVDKNFHRIKVKTPTYVALSNLKSNLADHPERQVVQVILTGESSEVLSYFPEMTELHKTMQSRIDAFVQEIESDFAKFSGISSQKDFANAISELPHKAILFALRSGKAKDTLSFLREMSSQNLETLFE